MKKNIIASAFAVAAVLSASSAFAAGGQVNFKGEIIDAGCEVVNTPSAPLDVTLGQVMKTEFTGAGSTAAATDFTLVLKNCPDTVHNAMVKFDGTNVTGDTSVLALTPESGVATGVGIQLADDANTVLPLFTASKAYPLSSTADNELKFVARYIATSDTVSVGPANSTANFSVTYN
ncbi:fimbrial protein [Buttiauxella sp. A111]|uniref:fimbrial protein n=1 Tax=Buttiauxella sp. A111 TaxID=2563088 RepID=UPI001610070C|nr:fimbrial protein [Buttiauxella sp. A111]